MLLVVSLGLSVVRDSLGSTMRKCQLLAGAHFIFGGLSQHSTKLATLIDTSYPSSLRSGHCGTRIRVNIGPRITPLCHSFSFHTEWILDVDLVLAQWSVFMALILYSF